MIVTEVMSDLSTQKSKSVVDAHTYQTVNYESFL